MHSRDQDPAGHRVDQRHSAPRLSGVRRRRYSRRHRGVKTKFGLADRIDRQLRSSNAITLEPSTDIVQLVGAKAASTTTATPIITAKQDVSEHHLAEHGRVHLLCGVARLVTESIMRVTRLRNVASRSAVCPSPSATWKLCRAAAIVLLQTHSSFSRHPRSVPFGRLFTRETFILARVSSRVPIDLAAQHVRVARTSLTPRDSSG